MIEYLSDEWFDEVGALLGASTGEMESAPTLTVQYEVHSVTGGCAQLHTQTFADGQLLTWVQGRSHAPDLIVRRSCEVDRADLLSRGDPGSIAESTFIGSAVVRPADIFGIATHQALGMALPVGLEITIGLACPDTPFGAVQRQYRLAGDRLHPTKNRADVTISGPFARVVSWIHEEQTLLGHLLVMDDYESTVEGDYFKMSAVEGCVSASRGRSTAGHTELLIAYAVCRSDPRLAVVVDRLDAVTR